MVSNHPWGTDDKIILQNPTFFFGDAVPSDMAYQRRCFQFSYSVDGKEKTIPTRSTFDCTISIMSLSPTCSKREDPPSWVKRTKMIKIGIFISGPSRYTEKLPSRIDMLIPPGGYQDSDHPSVDLRLVGFVIFRGDGNNRVKPFRLRGRFSADLDQTSWTDHVLQAAGAILKETGILDGVHAFQETVISSDEAFMAILESFLPQTNTFIVTNGEIYFSLKGPIAIIGLPILETLSGVYAYRQSSRGTI